MRFLTSDDKLVIKLQKFEILAALKFSVTVRREDITAIEWLPGELDLSNYKGLRMPGTCIPGVIIAGSFLLNKKWQFWHVRLNRPNELVIRTTKKRYAIIRLSCEKDIAQAVQDWWQGNAE